jgi:signal transduction histidine kinase
LSEVARSRLGTAPADSARLLEDIASAGRELLDGMSDIVWAVDPRLDHVADLALRIRDFAGSSLDETGISWKFDVAGDESLFPLAPEHRRHIYLVFKEAIRNAIRHSGCSSLHLALVCSPEALRGEIADNGRGIAADCLPGNGRRNMHTRVTALGGHLEVQSLPAQGTAIKFQVPLNGVRNK